MPVVLLIITLKNLKEIIVRHYQIEYHPAPNFLSIHLDKEFTSEFVGSVDTSDWDEEEIPPIVIDFLQLPGITDVAPERYRLVLEKGNLFSWDEIIGSVIVVLQMHLEPHGKIEEIAAPIKHNIDHRGFMYNEQKKKKRKLHSARLFKEEKGDSIE